MESLASQGLYYEESSSECAHVSINEAACHRTDRTLMGCTDPPSKGCRRASRVNEKRWGVMGGYWPMSIRLPPASASPSLFSNFRALSRPSASLSRSRVNSETASSRTKLSEDSIIVAIRSLFTNDVVSFQLFENYTYAVLPKPFLCRRKALSL